RAVVGDWAAGHHTAHVPGQSRLPAGRNGPRPAGGGRAAHAAGIPAGAAERRGQRGAPAPLVPRLLPGHHRRRFLRRHARRPQRGVGDQPQPQLDDLRRRQSHRPLPRGARGPGRLAVAREGHRARHLPRGRAVDQQRHRGRRAHPGRAGRRRLRAGELPAGPRPVRRRCRHDPRAHRRPARADPGAERRGAGAGRLSHRARPAGPRRRSPVSSEYPEVSVVQQAMKRFIPVVVVALLLGAGIWGYLHAQSRNSSPKYRLAQVERGPLTAAVSATGNLNAVVTVQVGSQVSGQIRELLVDFNSVVRRGQVIARIDPQIFEAQVNQAKADVETAKAAVLNQTATVEKARADVENARAALAQGKAQTAKSDAAQADSKRIFERNAELFKRQLIAQADRDTAQANYDQAVAQSESARASERALAAAIDSSLAQLRVQEAALKSARAQVDQKTAALAQAQTNLNYTTIRAPVDGVVVSRAVDMGQTVAASLQAPTLFTIAQDLTKMQVETSVDEADIGRIKLEDRATFTVDAFPGQTFSGVVTQIRKAAQIVQNVVTYTVVISVDNPGGRLLPGMTANVKLVYAEKSEVLKVPNAALRFRPAGADTGPAAPSRGQGGAPAAGPAPRGDGGGRTPGEM